MTKLINGKQHSQELRNLLKTHMSHLSHKRPPCLAIILVGERPDSKIYVNIKKKTCAEIGIECKVANLPDETTYKSIISIIQNCNSDNTIHGIIVQLPLPQLLIKHQRHILETIDPKKDVDGLHSYNIGNFFQPSFKERFKNVPYFIDNYLCKESHDILLPCTPLGIIYLLSKENIQFKGTRITIIGCGQVGLPLSILLTYTGAVVINCDRHTNDQNPDNLERLIKETQVLITCVGRPHMIPGSWIPTGCTVIDVGISQITSLEDRRRIVGDVDYKHVIELGKAKSITPVPGGVGPMTVSMLLLNLLKCFGILEGDNSIEYTNYPT